MSHTFHFLNFFFRFFSVLFPLCLTRPLSLGPEGEKVPLWASDTRAPLGSVPCPTLSCGCIVVTGGRDQIQGAPLTFPFCTYVLVFSAVQLKMWKDFSEALPGRYSRSLVQREVGLLQDCEDYGLASLEYFKPNWHLFLFYQ